MILLYIPFVIYASTGHYIHLQAITSFSMPGDSEERVPALASRSSVSVATDAELRTASEAMQRAAEAMIAATESFRQQYHQAEGGTGAEPPRPSTSYHPYEPIPMDDGHEMQHHRPQGRRNSIDMQPSMSRMTYYGSSTQLPFSGANSVYTPSRPPTIYLSPERSHAQLDYTPNTTVPVPAISSEYLPHHHTRSSLPHLNTGHNPNAFGARVARAAAAGLSYDGHGNYHHYPPMPEWPPHIASTHNLHHSIDAPLLGGPPPSVYYPAASTSQMDLYDGGYKMNPDYKERMSKHYSLAQSMATSTDEPSPIIKIGRYTYLRSAHEDFGSGVLSEYIPGPLDPKIPSRAASKRGPPAGDDSPYGFSLGREYAFVSMVCISQVLMLAGIAQAMVPAHIIGNSFPNTTFGDMAWYSAAYGLTAGTFVLPSGRLGDLFGHKKMFIIGFLWFGLWSLICGFAERVQAAGYQGTVFFCFSRAMQGIGPALLVPNGQAMLGRGYKPGPRKNMVMCLFGAAAPLGFFIGAIMASVFSMHASWPWAFWTMAAVCVALAAISVLVMPDTGVKGLQSGASLWSELDGAGMLLGVAGLVLFNFAFNQAPIVSWNTPYTYFLLVIGLILIGAFIFVETVVSRPLVPISAMKSSTVFVLACTGTGWGCFSIWVFYAILFIENLRGWDALLTSVAFAPAPITGLAASMLTGFLMSRLGPPGIMFISMCAFFAGSLLLVTSPVNQSYWFNTFFGILVMPFGMDMSNPAATILLSNSVSKEHQGIAASLVVTVVNYSISIALGFAGTVEVNLHNGGSDLLAGYRGAQYFGLGLGGLGVLLAAAFLVNVRMNGGTGGPPGPGGPPGEKGPMQIEAAQPQQR
ncbi:hypothetical protein ACKVV1_006117 [Pyricularia oryzae]